MRFNRKSKIIVAIITPLLVLGVVLGLYFGLVHKRKDSSELVAPNQNTVNTKVEPELKIFPELITEDFYSYIEIKDGKAFITDDFIAAVVNFVVSKMQISSGDLQWSYGFINEDNRQDVTISFRWIPSPTSTFEAQNKSYRFDISTL